MTQGARTLQRRGADRTEDNARWTAVAGSVTVFLLAAEGMTVLRVSRRLGPNVFIGMLLVTPILLTMGSTSWTFAHYDRGDTGYRRQRPKGGHFARSVRLWWS